MMQNFQRNIIFLPLQSWDIVVSLGKKALYPEKVHLNQVEMSTWEARK